MHVYIHDICTYIMAEDVAEVQWLFLEWMCVHIYMYTHTHLYMYVYIYIFI